MSRRPISAISSVLAVVVGVRVAAWLLEPVLGSVVVVAATVLSVLLICAYVGRR